MARKVSESDSLASALVHVGEGVEADVMAVVL